MAQRTRVQTFPRGIASGGGTSRKAALHKTSAGKTVAALHKTSFENPDKRNSTELSKYIWQLKKEKRRFSIKWTILKQTPSYRSGAKNCDLCLQEKLHILKGDKTKLLNKRCELFSKCRHRKRFLAGKFERACAVPSRV